MLRHLSFSSIFNDKNKGSLSTFSAKKVLKNANFMFWFLPTNFTFFHEWVLGLKTLPHSTTVLVLKNHIKLEQ
jgi:hypothetical protein